MEKGDIRMVKNEALNHAKSAQKDEFYTQLVDIEAELRHYKDQFRGKVVYCNCDDPTVSNFFKYFWLNFKYLGLKKLIASCYRSADPNLRTAGVSDKAVWLEYNGEPDDSDMPRFEHVIEHAFVGDGDFRNDESVDLLKKADIVVTNPPFSLFREYVAQLIEFNKRFVILGNMNAITYKEIFPLIRDNKLWLGSSIHSGDREFGVPKSYPLKAAGFRIDEHGNKFIRVKGVRWFTNLDFKERHEDLLLYKSYNADEYPKYDNYAAINVNKTKEIPIDYDGVMGVPITFLDKYNPDQFEIIGATESEGTGFSNGLWDEESSIRQGVVHGKKVYKRIFIKNKKPVNL